MTNRRQDEIVVVGGGIAGLSAAWELTSTPNPPRVTLLESADNVGGKIASVEVGGRLVDAGPDGALARRSELATLAAELSLGDDLVPIQASGASVYARGQVRTLPSGLQFGIPTDLRALRDSQVLSTRGYLRALRDRFAPVPASRGPLQDRAIGNLVETKLGHEVVATLVDPMLGGINAGRVSEMSAAAVFPALLEAGQERGSLMAALKALTPPPASEGTSAPPQFNSLDQGMFHLIERIERALGERGVEIHTQTPVTQLSRAGGANPGWTLNSSTSTIRADGVVLAMPAQPASAALAELDAELSGLLGSIEYASVAIVTFIFNEADLSLPESGTGVLIPPGTQHPHGEAAGQRFLSTALTFLDRKWAHWKVGSTAMLRVHMGRIDDTRTLDLDDAQLIERAHEECAVLLDHVGAPLASCVVRWERSLPQYQVGHLLRVAAIENAVARHRFLRVAGAAFRGVGVPACIASGRSAGANLREELEARGQ
jgi:protoporphyrinogen/coproporphyrinogen III oxidase